MAMNFSVVGPSLGNVNAYKVNNLKSTMSTKMMEKEAIDYDIIDCEKTKELAQNYVDEKLLKNLGKNSLFYLGSGIIDVFADAAIKKISTETVKGAIGVGVLKSFSKIVPTILAKGSSSMTFGGTFVKGIAEGGIKKTQTETVEFIKLLKKYKLPKNPHHSNSVKDLLKNTEAYNRLTNTKLLKTLAQRVNINISDDALKRLTELTKSDKVWNWKTNKGNIIPALKSRRIKTAERQNKWINKGNKLTLEAGISGSAFLSAIGIDYVAGLVTNVAVSCIINDKSVKEAIIEDSKAGSTLLKSVWKTTCKVAFEKIGSLAGPAGKKLGGAIGSVVGAEIGSFCSDVLFEGEEGWCAAAGVATAVGATAAGVFTTALITAGVISVSVPVGGVIVGAVIIAGAAVGTLLTWLVKEVVT